ncbi:MAG: Tm-1-like ATP-binding domain-containing protein [Deltaproteobacteria bacterium]|nr:Tm-1-like ATP-binding domain-containing protein [Deltaproteobacteria bacterium]
MRGKKTIVLLGTFDTKAQEFLYAKNLIEKEHFAVLSVDVGTGARGRLLFPPDFSREEVARAAGTTLEEILALGKAGQEIRIIELMAEGAVRICRSLHDEGRLDGVLSLGGTMGTNLGTKVMRGLPFGVPKVMLSTVASGDTAPYVATTDIVMIPSIADIAGLNRITEVTLTQAASAIMGMAAAAKPSSSNRPLVGITTLGGTTNCALQAKSRLEARGYEVVIFHSNGMGGKAMEEMIAQGLISAVFDLSTNEVVDHLYQGWSDSGPTRMEEAGRRGIPQLIAPGNIDHIIYSSPEKIPERFRKQHVHVHAQGINVLRTKKNEMIEVARCMADKINRASGEAAVLVPLKGLSVLDLVEKEFDDPEANAAFTRTLKEHLKPGVEVKEVDVHVTETSFGDVGAEMLIRLIEQAEGGAPAASGLPG